MLSVKGLSWSVTGVVILLFTITAVVATSIVCCVMVLFASVKTGLFSVVTSVVGCFSLFLF